MRVPVLDLKRQYASIKGEIDAAVLDVLCSTQYVLGPYVKEFEEAAAAYCGCEHAIGVASGTDALLLSLKALGIGSGDAVILPSFTFFATAGAVHNVGATPVFCDIDPRTFNLDPGHLREVLGKWTLAATPRAVIPVHLYGQMADMSEILALAEAYDLAVVEDAAQAIGATYAGAGHGPSKAGTLGDLGCFSFYPTKNLGAYGDGGMITTNDDALAERIHMLRVHGAKPKYVHKVVGINSRLDAIQGAILGVKLRYLDRWSAARRNIAARYDEGLSDIDGLITPFRADERSHVFHQYTVRVSNERRDDLKDYLKKQGIGSAIYYPVPLHLQECFARLGYREGELLQSEKASREVLSLPIFPELATQEQEYTTSCIASLFHHG